jgi:N-ethylmaleimide reductase
MPHDILFETVRLGDLTLPNRVVMPPMTRSRASQPGDIPNALMAEYYAQRASAGLIISEGTFVSPMGKGYAWTPGIYTPEQLRGWRLVTNTVHRAGGRIYAQLWHVGRVSHADLLNGATPVSASAIRANGVKVILSGANSEAQFGEVSQPRALEKGEIADIVEQFRVAAIRALEAGFDGVELHAANGYLVNQFLDSGSNERSDEYGGSLENRLRFLDEVARALVGAAGGGRVGVRLAPLTTLNGCVDANPEETYTAAARRLGEIGVGYIHIAEADWDDAPPMAVDFRLALRDAYPGVIIYAGKYDGERARRAIEEGWADLIGFGRPYVANPDLTERLRLSHPLAPHQPETLFGGGAPGLTDYSRYAA